MSLDPDDYPAYMAPRFMDFRPQRAARMLLEDSSITFDELVAYKLSTHLEFADRILDDLFVAVETYGSDRAKAAKMVLENWDRTADADSKGVVLFYNWAQKFNVWRDTNYAVGWDMAKPNTTPDGLANPGRAVELLEAAATETLEKFGNLEVPWGDFYRIKYHEKNLPANGIDGSMGVFRVAWPGGANENNLYVGGGDSWVGVIEFGDEVRAKVLLSYGNATQKDSPHYGDQLELFSKKELRDAWFGETEVQSNTAKIEILTENGFQEKK
jgi:acyl-homoserine-lactone acylase